jgi:hypothetical protein
MDMEISPTNPLDHITSKEGWGTVTQALPELKAMFEEARQKGHAKLGTVLHCLFKLKQSIQDPHANLDTRIHRQRAIEKIEGVLKTNKLAPQIQELGELQKRLGYLENSLHQMEKHKYHFTKEREDGTMVGYIRESRELSEKIRYIETSDAYKTLLEERDLQSKTAWDLAFSQLSPQEQEFVNLNKELRTLELTLHDCGKDGEWHQQADLDGSWEKWEARIEKIQELKESPEYTAAKLKIAELYADELKKLRQS